MDFKKNWLELILAGTAVVGVVSVGAAQVAPVIAIWWAGHWVLVEIAVGLGLAGGTARKWLPFGWKVYATISDRMDVERMREQHYAMLSAVTDKMEQGFDTNYKNASLGFEISVHNPYMKNQVKIQEVPAQELLAPVVPKAPGYAEVDSLITDQRLVLCYTQDGPVFGTILDLLSMCVVGKPGRGKSTALLYYILILLKAGAEVWIWDPHSGLNELSYGLNYYDTLEGIEQSVPILHAKLDQRLQLWREKKETMHPLLLIADELPVIADYENDRIEEAKMVSKAAFLDYDQKKKPSRLLKRFVLEARKLLGFVIVSGQAVPANVLNTLTRDNMSSRIVFESCNMHAKMAGLQKDEIDKLMPSLKGTVGQGIAVMDVSRWSKPVLAAFPNTTVEDLRAFIDYGRVVESNGRDDIEPLYGDFGTRPDDNDEDFYSAQSSDIGEKLTGDLEDGLNEPVEGKGDSPSTRPYSLMNEAQAAQFIALYPFLGIEKAIDGIEGCNHRHRDHARELIEQYNLKRKRA